MKHEKINIKKTIKRRILLNMNNRNKLRRSGRPNYIPRVSTFERNNLRKGITSVNNNEIDALITIRNKHQL